MHLLIKRIRRLHLLGQHLNNETLLLVAVVFGDAISLLLSAIEQCELLAAVTYAGLPLSGIFLK